MEIVIKSLKELQNPEKLELKLIESATVIREIFTSKLITIALSINFPIVS